MRVEEIKVEEKTLEDLEKEDNRYQKLHNIIQEYKDQEGSLITILHQTQNIFGNLTRDILIYIAKSLGIPLAEVYGVVSFYPLFSMKARGKYTIEICMGTACYVKGSEDILNALKEKLDIEPGEISEDGRFTIETTRCMGACSLAPVISIDDDVHSQVKVEEISGILEQYE